MSPMLPVVATVGISCWFLVLHHIAGPLAQRWSRKP